MWIQRGADAFSEDPDPGEDLYIEYLNDSGQWIELERIRGNGQKGQIFDRTYTIGADGRHAGFQLRFRQSDGSGNGYDYFHVDDVCVNGTAVPTTDHFVVSHDNYGLNCLAETISVRVEDAANNPVTTYTETVTLDTRTGNGTWSLISGAGTLSDPVADDGLATYQWGAGDSEAVFSLSYPTGSPVVDIDVYQTSDPSLADDDSEGTLSFSPSGFTLTETALGNPPAAPVSGFDATEIAATNFAVHIAAYGQTPDDPVCGIIESYAGSKPLEFWYRYDDPVTGTRAPTIDSVAAATSEAGVSPQTVTFVNGQASVTARYRDSGRIQLFVRDVSPAHPDLPGGIRGATEPFVVRPRDALVVRYT